MKDGRDELNQKVEEMNAEVTKLMKVLQAKEAVLEDNVLKSEVKQRESVDFSGFKCHIAWSALFSDNICIAMEVQNDTHYAILPSCFAICKSDLSDTMTVIFDEVLTTQYISPGTRRMLLVSFRKGLLISGQVILILDCDIVTVSDSRLDLAISLFLPSSIHNKQTRIVKIFDIDKPLKTFAVSEIDDLSLKEGLKLYQCLYVSYFSVPLDVTPSHLRSILPNIGKFREVDFGDWQFFIGETNTVWNNFIIYTNSSFMENISSRCRLFSKYECDMRRMKEILIENNELNKLKR
uniref:Uncharacterized protein n=1 Tax=Setaria digitata TaxID=48799 RepID=A0A915PMI4_9BILA